MSIKAEHVTPNIDKSQNLWRYMTLDRLINLLDTKKLFFTPIKYYASSDPFEGLLPKASLDAIAGVLSSTQGDLLERINRLQEHILSSNPDSEELKSEATLEFDKLRVKALSHAVKMEDIYFNLMSSVVVNCWHKNDFESEAMWKLYSDSHKGIAIQTTAGSLIESVVDSRADIIYFSEIKYINFDSPDLTPGDCIVNGNIGPLLKRTAFAHENEARLYFVPNKSYHNLDEAKPAPEFIDIDINRLIHKVFISPYASEPFPSSVRCVLRMFGISDDKIVQSDLLTPSKSLTRMF